jgi:predicted TIM-barrel fold metal-dependent hydrolase
MKPFVQRIQEAVAELEFCARHGAVAVLLKGREHGIDVSSPHHDPRYEKAQKLGLSIAVHTGLDGSRTPDRSAGPGLFGSMAHVLDACFPVLKSDVALRFPGLRWGFFEAGAGWAPWLVQNALRSDAYALRDERSATGAWKAQRSSGIETASWLPSSTTTWNTSLAISATGGS